MKACITFPSMKSYVANLRLTTCLGACFLALPALGQVSPATLPADLKLSIAGEVKSFSLQADGKLVVAGSFSAVNGVPRTNVVRLNPNGSVDLTWNPSAMNPGSQVERVLANSLGIFVSGSFTNIGGVSPSSRVARLDPVTGAVDPAWNPPFTSDGPPEALASDGVSLFVGIRLFTDESVSPRLFKVSGSGTGAIDPSWNPLTNGSAHALAISGTNLFVAGSFTRIGGRNRAGLARISTQGSGLADSNWDPNPTMDVNFNGYVWALALDGANLFVGGGFASIGGRNRSRIAKLRTDGNGAADATWNPSADLDVYHLSVVGSSLYAAGEFQVIGGLNLDRMAKLSTTGTGAADPAWIPPVLTIDLPYRIDPGDRRAEINGLLATPAGVLVGGNFSLVNELTGLGIVRLDTTTGLKDGAYPTQIEQPGTIYAMARQPDGKLVLGGRFFFANGLPRSGLLRLNADGTLDPTWFPQANGVINALAIAGTDIFAGGHFTRIGGLDRRYLAKLSSTGTDAADPLWNPDPDDWVESLAVSGNSLFAGGWFRWMGGQRRTLVAKLDTQGAGAVDPVWRATAFDITFDFLEEDSVVVALKVAGTNLFVGGSFFFQTGQATVAGHLAKVSVSGTGAVDQAWLPSPNYFVHALELGPNALYVGGNFSFIGGQNRSLLAKLSLTTALADPVWNPNPTSQYATIWSLALAGQTLYVGGRFDSIGGLTQTNLARIDAAGTGMADSSWARAVTGIPYQLLASGADVYAAGWFANIGGQSRFGVAFLPVADAPQIVEGTNALIFVRRHPEDGAEITHFRVTALGSAIALFQSDGLTPVREGDFLTAGQGSAGLRFTSLGSSNSFVSFASALNDTPPGAGSAVSTRILGAAQPPAFTFSNATYRVNEGGGALVIHILKSRPGAASVTVATQDGTALGGPDYQTRSNLLSFASGETVKSLTIGIADDFETEGDQTFSVRLLNPTGGALIGTPGAAFVTIIDNDGVGSPDSLVEVLLPNPSAPPPSTGILVAQLQPGAAGGQWRLAGEFAWRDSGSAARGLVTGNYRLEFKPVSGFLEPPAQTVPVTAGTSNQLVFFYTAAGSISTGDLTVLVHPEEVAEQSDIGVRGQWRRQGQVEWLNSGDRLSGLSAGIHLIEFKPVAGRATPPAQSVVVASNQVNVAAATYLHASEAPGLGPQVLSTATATTAEPYLFNGQIQTDIGFGSGVVVKPRVVLTAAHVLFDDVLLGFAQNARWFFQKHKGDHEPLPQTPRGWYIFEGYAAQRQADNSPGLSSPSSQELDAAALFFVESPTHPNLPGRGGYGGYLASDELNNPWLTGSQLKMLVGYPIDRIDATNQGRMHATVPTNATFTSTARRVFATSDLKSYPGNSGGPLYVQYVDGKYYPAAIYLGGASQTLVRAIDSQVVDLINRAEISGNGGGNNTGGGVALWSPGLTGSPFVPGLFRVNFLPVPVNERAAWRVRGATDPAWISFSSTNIYYPLIPGPFNIEFKPVNGYIAPPFRRVEVVADQITLIDAVYRPLRLEQLTQLPGGSYRMTLDGGTGRVYTLQGSADLRTWSNVVTLTNVTGLTNLVDNQAAGQGRRFYRVEER